MFVKGHPVPDAQEAIRLFSLCSAMNWAQLPEDGGLYSQHPVLLEKFAFIFSEQARHEKEQREDEERKRKQNSNTSKPKRRFGRRGR